MIGILLGAAVLGGAAFGAIGIALTAICGLVGVQLGWLRPIPLLLLVVAASAGFWRAGALAATGGAPAWAETRHAFYASVSNSPISDGSNQKFVATLAPASRSEKQTAPGCVSGPILSRVGRGDRIYLVGDVRTASQVSPSYASFMDRRGCVVALTTYGFEVISRGTGLRATLDRVRERMSARVQRLIPGDAGALVSGLATGDDAALSDGTRQAFFTTGVSHITAVSGSNLALLVAFFTVAGGAAGWRRKFVWQLATVAVIWTYVVLIGLGASAFRAALVATLAIVALRLGRKPDLLTLSVLVAATEVMIRPADLNLLSFQLSTASAIGLLLALGAPTPASSLGWIARAAVGSASANLATAPFLLLTVGLPSPVRSILANLVIAPFVEVLFPLSAIISIVALVSRDGAAVLAPPVEVIARVSLEIVRRFAKAPGSTMPPGSLPLSRWALTVIVVLILGAFSQECRGGAYRLGRRWRAADPVWRRFAAGVVASAAAGAAMAMLIR